MKKRMLAILLCIGIVLSMTAMTTEDTAANAEADTLAVPCEERGKVDSHAESSLQAEGNNVLNTNTSQWYSTLSEAVKTAGEGHVLDVYNDITETETVVINQKSLQIRAAENKNPTISWTATTKIELGDLFSYGNVTPYSCIVINAQQGGNIYFGDANREGTLTLDASSASDDDNAQTRARVMAYRYADSSVTNAALYFFDGIVVKGGNTGGGNYDDTRDSTRPENSVSNYLGGQGAGLLMINGTFNMEGGIIRDNYSLWGVGSDKTASNVGGGGGVYLHRNTTMNLSGGQIIYNAAGTNGGGGIIVGGAAFNMTGGEVSNNNCNFASGGGIYVIGGSEVSITGGEISYNHANSYGGGLFTRGNGSMTFENNVIFNGNSAGLDGGAVMFWTSGTDIDENTLTIQGDAEFTNNSASNGGAVAIGYAIDYANNNCPAKLVISGNVLIENNTANNNGGGIFLQENPNQLNEVHISETPIIKNNAAKYGGGICFNSGKVIMAGGELEENTASVNGGALYIDNGDFTMTSGSIVDNHATGTDSSGGGIYVNNGDITIGIENCTGEETNHTVAPTDKSHPVIKENTAVDSGGGIALFGEGNIKMYCGDVIGNDATNRGRGLNVYMEDGTFDYYTGADVGTPEEPEVVIVGGELIDHNHNTEDKLTLQYHHCNDLDTFTGEHTGDLADKTATATKGTSINLPDGEKYWDAPDGYRFFGWTFYGPNAENAPEFVRTKDHYKPLGEPIKVEDTYDETPDDILHWYALWAPEESDITYAGSVINGAYVEDPLSTTTNPTFYTFTVGSNPVTLQAPEKAGYTFEGWYIYQDEGQNANWGHEPIYKTGTADADEDYDTLDYEAMKAANRYLAAAADGSYVLEMGDTFFGNLTLIAEFAPAYTDLKITKTGADTELDENQTFLFQVTGDPDDEALENVNITVTICGNGSVTIKDLPVGEYEVKELTAWSWRYTPDSDKMEVTLDNPEVTEEVTFTNTRDYPAYWLGGDHFLGNLFGPYAGAQSGTTTN